MDAKEGSAQRSVRKEVDEAALSSPAEAKVAEAVDDTVSSHMYIARLHSPAVFRRYSRVATRYI